MAKLRKTSPWWTSVMETLLPQALGICILPLPYSFPSTHVFIKM